jgi:hypothetical protein
MCGVGDLRLGVVETCCKPEGRLAFCERPKNSFSRRALEVLPIETQEKNLLQ